MYHSTLSPRTYPLSADDFGIVSDSEALKILHMTGLNISGFRRVMATRGVRHVKNNHSDPEREIAQQQYPVTPDDFALIPLGSGPIKNAFEV